MTPIKGFATAEGTKRFAQRAVERSKGRVRSDFYRVIEGLTLSTLGIGTYLGEPDQTDDRDMREAVLNAVLGGINVIDSAINYRAQRSERIIGQALTELIEGGEIKRDEIFVATKGGFIPFDGEYPADSSAYFRDRFIKTGILAPEDVVAGCHCMTPKYIEDQFNQSRKNLNLETIDLYYVHNPETQLEEVTRDEFIHRIHRAFQVLENKVAAKQLQFYGTATWNGYRVGSDSRELLVLNDILEAASDHGKGHGFKFIQLPFNLAMPEAMTEKNQHGKSILTAAAEKGIHVMTSASIMQAKILGRLPANLDVLAPAANDAVKALNFVRSAPGVDIALCGMKKIKHLSQNLELAGVPQVDAATLAGALGLK